MVCAVEEIEKSILFSGKGGGGGGCFQNAENRILLPSVSTLLSLIVGCGKRSLTAILMCCSVLFTLDVPPVFPPPSNLFSILLQITNNAGCPVTVISNDAKPLNGETLLPNSMLTVSKLTSHMKPVKFFAVDSATEKRLLINGMESVNVSPSTKQIMMPLVISGK